jgi:transcriptional regulator with XRE-family HTH domain
MLVQKLRLQKGWSQQQLADLSGLSVRTIQRIEQGHSASVESLKSLAAVFEIDFSTLQEPDMSASPSPALPPSLRETTAQGHQNADEALALHHVRKLKGLYRHLIRYGLVIGALAVFNLWRHPDRLWFLWVAAGWGIGVAFHAIRVLEWGPFGPAWEKAQVEKRLGRKL